jgi:hypothetical protein
MFQKVIVVPGILRFGYSLNLSHRKFIRSDFKRRSQAVLALPGNYLDGMVCY